jgi:hypothetical protein
MDGGRKRVDWKSLSAGIVIPGALANVVSPLPTESCR